MVPVIYTLEGIALSNMVEYLGKTEDGISKYIMLIGMYC